MTRNKRRGRDGAFAPSRPRLVSLRRTSYRSVPGSTAFAFGCGACSSGGSGTS